MYMYVCLSVTGLQWKYMSLHIVYVPLRHVPLMMPSGDMRSRSRTRRIKKKTTPEWVQMYGRRLTAQQKDERQQDEGNKKWLARHHPNDYFARWPVNGIGWGQHGVVSTALRASTFRTFHVLRVRHMMRMGIPSYHLDFYPCVWQWTEKGKKDHKFRIPDYVYVRV